MWVRLLFFVCCVSLVTVNGELLDITELVAGSSLKSTWLAATGSPGFYNQPPSYWKDDVFVYLQGSVTPINSNSTFSNITQLPSGFRPSLTHRFICTTAPDENLDGSVSRHVIVEVSPSGDVRVVSLPSGTSIPSLNLDGIRFTYAFTNEFGDAVDTSDGLFQNIDGADLSSVNGYYPPQVYTNPITGVTYLRGVGKLNRTDCTDSTTESCDIFLLASSYVPRGFESETAVFPQVNAASGSYLLFYSAVPNAQARLYKGSSGDVLSLDSVTLLPTSIEMARGMPTVQSSVANNGFPERANDGNTNTDFSDGSCILTNSTSTSPALATEVPWWRVDLGKMVAVKFVRITARGDCCPDALNGFEIRIGNDLTDDGNQNALCGSTHFLSQGTTQDFGCGLMNGRYINVHRTDTSSPLTLCEVMVFASAQESPSGLQMQILELNYDSLYGGWIKYASVSTPRALRLPGKRVCLAGRLTFVPVTESFSGHVIGTIAKGWRPTYRTKLPVACYVHSAASVCVLSIEPRGQISVQDSSSEPAVISGVANWIALDGICYGGSEYLTTITLTGGAVLELEGSSFIGVAQ
eukprot:c9361_g1_i1.p1 GENE.c9361_g1_i1~~c9361_g1_i1.p1  ORF type:complete len:593 (-),score=129.27 c9361_g1_i1:280-2019(-)